MISLVIKLNGDGILAGFPMEKIINLDDTPITITTLEGGMQSGAPSVGFIFDLPDGRKVFAQTSVRLFISAADAIKARYGDLLNPRVG